MLVEELGLIPIVRRAAEFIQIQHPEAVFTSGKREAWDQARAMAINAQKYGPAWLMIYHKKHPRLVNMLMTHMEENPGRVGGDLVRDFFDTMTTFYRPELSKFPHVVGRAFDIAWQSEDLTRAIVKTLEGLPQEMGLELILTNEAGHKIIHAQFATPMVVTV